MTTPAPTTPRKTRPMWARGGWWLLTHFWPAILVALAVSLVLWDRAPHRAVWLLAGGAGIVFLGLWTALERRTRKAGRATWHALKGVVFSLLAVGALVGATWFLFLR